MDHGACVAHCRVTDAVAASAAQERLHCDEIADAKAQCEVRVGVVGRLNGVPPSPCDSCVAFRVVMRQRLSQALDQAARSMQAATGAGHFSASGGAPDGHAHALQLQGALDAKDAHIAELEVTSRAVSSCAN